MKQTKNVVYFLRSLVYEKRAIHPSTGLIIGSITFYISRLGGKKTRGSSGNRGIGCLFAFSRLSFYELLKQCMRKGPICCGLSYIHTNGFEPSIVLFIIVSSLSGSHGEWTMSDDINCYVCDQPLYRSVELQNGNRRILHHSTHFRMSCDRAHNNDPNNPQYICVTCAANCYSTAVIARAPLNCGVSCPLCRRVTRCNPTFLMRHTGIPTMDIQGNIGRLQEFIVRAGEYRQRHPEQWVDNVIRITTDMILVFGNQQQLNDRRHVLMAQPHAVPNGVELFDPQQVALPAPPIVVPQVVQAPVIPGNDGLHQPIVPADPLPPPINPPLVAINNDPVVPADPVPPIAQLVPGVVPVPPIQPVLANPVLEARETVLYTQKTILDGSIYEMSPMGHILMFLILISSIFGHGLAILLFIPLLIIEKVIVFNLTTLKFVFSLMFIIMLSVYIEMELSEVESLSANVKMFTRKTLKSKIRLFVNMCEYSPAFVGVGILLCYIIPFVLTNRSNHGLFRVSQGDLFGWPLFIPSFTRGTYENWFLDTKLTFSHLPPNVAGASPYRGYIKVFYYGTIVDKCVPSRYANEATSNLLRYIGGDVQNVLIQEEIPLSAVDPIILMHTVMVIHQVVLTARYTDEMNNAHVGRQSVRDLQW